MLRTWVGEAWEDCGKFKSNRVYIVRSRPAKAIYCYLYQMRESEQKRELAAFTICGYQIPVPSASQQELNTRNSYGNILAFSWIRLVSPRLLDCWSAHRSGCRQPLAVYPAYSHIKQSYQCVYTCVCIYVFMYICIYRTVYICMSVYINPQLQIDIHNSRILRVRDHPLIF